MKCKVRFWDIGEFVRKRAKINIDPPYQRGGDAWEEPMRQLLIESIINGYDIPKFYLHQLKDGSQLHEYDVLDGKQRLTTIFGFIDNKFPLAEGKNEFEFTAASANDDDPKPGDFFEDLSSSWKDEILDFAVTVTIVTNADEIEATDFFTRLNKGKQLNNPELRRSIGSGALLQLAEKIAKDDFFTKKAKLSNDRLHIEDMATKFLLIEDLANFSQKGEEPYIDMKRQNLDKLVVRYKKATEDKKTSKATYEQIKILERKVNHTLRTMKEVFEDNSSLLEKSAIQFYYLFIRKIKLEYAHENLDIYLKDFLEGFENDRLGVREKIRKTSVGDDNIPQLNLTEEKEQRIRGFVIEQSKPNDKKSLQMRVNIMTRDFLETYPGVVLKDTKRNFTKDEKFIVYMRSGKKCAECGREFKDFSDFEADHVVAWSKGGETTLANAQALCRTCNRKLGAK